MTIKDVSMFYLVERPRREPPCDFGDIRKSSIDANVFPYSPQPLLNGLYCIFAYHQNSKVIYTGIPQEIAFKRAYELNDIFWSTYKGA